MTTTAAVDYERLVTLLHGEIDAGHLTLPVMPDIAMRVKEEAANPTSSARRLAQIIGGDGALAARVLKMANSAIYAGLSEIRDLDHAIGRLGTAMVVALVIGAAGKEAFRSDEPEFQAMLADSWSRSLFASAVGRLIAEPCGLDREESFLAGLLHASGESVLLESLRKLMFSGAIEHPESALTRRALEELAPTAGARLLKKWGLPASLWCAVEFQAEPARAPIEHGQRAALVSLVAGFAQVYAAGQGRSELMQHPAVVQLGILPDTIDTVFSKASDDAREFARVL